MFINALGAFAYYRVAAVISSYMKLGEFENRLVLLGSVSAEVGPPLLAQVVQWLAAKPVIAMKSPQSLRCIKRILILFVVRRSVYERSYIRCELCFQELSTSVVCKNLIVIKIWEFSKFNSYKITFDSSIFNIKSIYVVFILWN